MEKATFNRWLEICKIMDKHAIERGRFALIFEDRTVEGFVYRNELGFCGLGYTDGDGVSVDFKSFCVLSSFIDVLSARKSFVDEDSAIEFRVGERKSKIGIEEKVEVNLPVWGSGKNAKVKSDEVFSVGEGVGYFIVDNKFCFGSMSFFGERELGEKAGVVVKLSPLFIDIFKAGKFEKFTVDEESVLMSDKDLEVTLFSSVEETAEDMDVKFTRDRMAIKEKAKLVVEEKDDIAILLDTLREMRNVGAGCIRLKVKGLKAVLTSIVGVELVQSINIKKEQEFEGCFGEDVLSLMKEIGPGTSAIYADDVMFLFEGKTAVIANIVEDIGR